MAIGVRIIEVTSGLGRSCSSRGGWKSLTGVVSRENGALERENMSVEDFFMKFYYKEEQRNEVVAVKKNIGSMECLFACFLSVFFLFI